MNYKSLLSCSHNTREIGGIKNCEGKLTKCGVFWRSDVPSEPLADDIEKLRKNNITTVIDMRTEAECLKKTSGLADISGFEYYNFPITEGSGVPDRLEDVPYSYMNIAAAENIPKVWRIMAESDGGVLFHCTAGKDRTGVVSAIILMLCGVEREKIIEDYVVSREYNKKRLEAFLAEHPEVDRNIVLANEKSMNGFIDLFTERFGTVGNYFETVGSSGRYADMIRNKLL